MNKIIVVEDDAAVQDAIQMVFSRAGFEVISYPNGQAILDGTAVMPDLYILDKQLPGVDGLDICRYLKAQAGTGHIPIIILSATPHVARLAKEACADGFMEKPFQNSLLLDLVRRLILKTG